VTKEKSRSAAHVTGPYHYLAAPHCATDGGIGKPPGGGVVAMSSRQISWYEPYLFAASLAERLGVDSCPVAGTAAWRALDDSDPAKLLAVVWAGVHWSLRIDTLQAAMAEASQEISTMANWGEVAQQVREREEFRREHPWAVRKP
jgi:Protein of unknown function (DUF2742)